MDHRLVEPQSGDAVSRDAEGGLDDLAANRTVFFWFL